MERIEKGGAWDETDEVVRVEVKRPLDKVIPVRLPSDKWEQIRAEARELVQCLTKDSTIQSLVSFPRRRESRSDTRWIPCQARNNTLYRYYDDTTLGIGPTTLARMWILERLRRQVQA